MVRRRPADVPPDRAKFMADFGLRFGGLCAGRQKGGDVAISRRKSADNKIQGGGWDFVLIVQMRRARQRDVCIANECGVEEIFEKRERKKRRGGREGGLRVFCRVLVEKSSLFVVCGGGRV